MLKKALIVALVLVVMLILFFLPALVRQNHYYADSFPTRDIPRPDLQTIAVRRPDMPPFVDRAADHDAGTVLVDRSHSNRFEMFELSVLQGRLSARGQRIETVEASWEWADKLRYAKALIIISPGEPFTVDEIQQIEDFVEKGGRLLLVTDPTRFGLRFDDYGYVVGLDSDVMHVNDLAARFGVVFQADYLYNTVEHEGNYRNIKLTGIRASDLTADVDQVVFYATHSIRADAPALITATGETRSSSSERVEELAVAVLAAEGQVLALGDMTFMTEPFNAVYDNDPFIADIADFVAGATRQYALTDFPYFFSDEVDLVYADAPLLDTDFLAGSGALQAYFAALGKELDVRQQEDPERDTLYLGVYAHTDDVESYLTEAGVTLVITPAAALEPAGVATPTLNMSTTVTHTLTLTTVTGVTGTTAVSPAVGSRLEIASLGEMVVTGTALLALQTDGERQTMLVLAHTETGLDNIIARLTTGDLAECLIWESPPVQSVTLGLCPTGEVLQGEGTGGWEEAEEAPPQATPTPTPEPTVVPTETVPIETPVGEPKGSILIVALDHGVGRYEGRTGADEYVQILQGRFDVTVWSMAAEGPPSADDLLGYDLLIWTAGDFEGVLGDEQSDMLFDALVAGKPVLISGAYLDDTAELAVQRDIQVEEATHPLARGFAPGEIISFDASQADYEVGVNQGEADEATSIVFVRGPASEASASPSVLVLEEELSGIRIALIGFPIYLLPQDAQTQLVENAVDWLLASSE